LQKCSATSYSPFELAKGWQLLTQHEIAKQNKDGVCSGAHHFGLNRQKMMEEAKDSLDKVAHHMKKYADAKRRHLEFDVRNQVLLKFTP